MTPKTQCPRCGESNYATSRFCWACGSALSAAPAPPAGVAPPAPVAEAPPVTEAPPVADAPAPKPSAPPAETAAEGRAPKPAELEAAALRDQAYVTPPVDADTEVRGPGDWLPYAVAWTGEQARAFREALDEYDRRRGHRSGAVSSFGCLMTGFTMAVVIALAVWFLSFLSARA